MPTLTDAGSPGRGPALERELNDVGVTVEHIILTHGDPDHVGLPAGRATERLDNLIGSLRSP